MEESVCDYKDQVVNVTTRHQHYPGVIQIGDVESPIFDQVNDKLHNPSTSWINGQTFNHFSNDENLSTPNFF